MSTDDSTTSWEQVRDESLAAMNETDRAEYDAASLEAEARLQLAELVYNARIAAGLSQAELARRAGTRGDVISAIESGAKAPGGVMLTRIVDAVGGTLGQDWIDAAVDFRVDDRPIPPRSVPREVTDP